MSNRFPRVLAGVFAAIWVAGCGGASPSKMASNLEGDKLAQLPNPAAGGGKPADAPKEEAITRRIIYNAAVDVIVKDVEQTRSEVARIVDEVKGYIAKSDISGQVGS